jgi:organic radical activating enzyme
MSNLFVSEIFGPTFQGEGKYIGEVCSFLRLAGCNLACRWCDTEYAWNWQKYNTADETSRLTPQEVAELLSKTQAITGIRNLVVTGGEPLLQQKPLAELFELLPGWSIDIETAGTIKPTLDNYVRMYSVSLKLSTTGDKREKRIVDSAIRAFVDTGKATYKFVCTSVYDLAEVDELVEEYGLDPVYIMPEGKDEAEIIQKMRQLAEPVKWRGYHLTTRMQVLLYGNQRRV